MYSFIRVLLTLLTCFFFSASQAQKPKDGVYVYSLSFEEWKGKSFGAKCTVVIKGDTVLVVHNGDSSYTGSKGQIIEGGLIMKHKSGKWIIGHDDEDRNASEIGGCAGGRPIIDFRKKTIRIC